jgi:lipopolysaccharide heptosyltransferase I
MKEILIIRLSSIGDVIHCTPVPKSIKMSWPDCKITWLVGENCAELLSCNPYIDEIIVWSREKFENYLRTSEFKKAYLMWKGLKKQLAAREFFAVLDIHGLFLTGMIAKMVKTKRRIGMSQARELNFLFMTQTAASLGDHITDRYLSVLTPLGITAVDHQMMLVVPEKDRQFSKDFLRNRGIHPYEKYAVLIPGTTWFSKNWPTIFFAQTAQLISNDFKIVICGGKAEIELGNEIEKMVGITVVNAVSQTTLLQMAGIIEGATVVVSGDTGPLHIAAAMQIPTVAIFGPTNPKVYAPKGEKSAAVFAKSTCSFCHKMKCPKGNATCMKSVTSQEVAARVYQVLETRQSFTEKKQHKFTKWDGKCPDTML